MSTVVLEKFLIVTDFDESSNNPSIGIYEAYKKELERQPAISRKVKIVRPSDVKGRSVFGKKYYSPRVVGKVIEEYAPEYIHIATEGPLGLAARRYCGKKKFRFSTASHVPVSEFGVPERLCNKYFRWFHEPAQTVFIKNQAVVDDYKKIIDKDYLPWDVFADLDIFSPDNKKDDHVFGEYILYVGAVEDDRRVDVFCELETDLNKIVVGDGNVRKKLEELYPDVRFLGEKKGKELLELYASAKVFAFPSPNAATGFAPLEAIASGVPVITLESEFSKIHIVNGKNGFAGKTLKEAYEEYENAITIYPREFTDNNIEQPCHKYSLHYSSLTFCASLSSRYL